MNTAIPDPDIHRQVYAGIPTKRLLAWVVDIAVIAALTALAVLLTALTGLFVLPVLWLCIGSAYRVITLANGSATLGMRLMGMELRTARDEAFDLPMAMLHTGGYTAQVMLPLFQLLSVVMICTTTRHQGLTDLVLGTVPMNRRLR